MTTGEDAARALKLVLCSVTAVTVLHATHRCVRDEGDVMPRRRCTNNVMIIM